MQGCMNRIFKHIVRQVEWLVEMLDWRNDFLVVGGRVDGRRVGERWLVGLVWRWQGAGRGGDR